MGKSMLVNMNDILLPAKEGKYGVGFFNAVNVEMARAIIETAEELQAPVMVGGSASPGNRTESGGRLSDPDGKESKRTGLRTLRSRSYI